MENPEDAPHVVRESVDSARTLEPLTRMGGEIPDLRGPRKIREGLEIGAVPSRDEATYWSPAETGREAEIRSHLHPDGGGVIEFTQEEEPERAGGVRTDDEAHEVAQESVATGRRPEVRDR